MKRRLLSIFMTVCMAVSLIPAAVLPAWAQTTQRSDWTGSQTTGNLIPIMNEGDTLTAVGWGNIGDQINLRAYRIDDNNYTNKVGIQARNSSHDIGNQNYTGGVYWQIDFSSGDRMKIDKGDLLLNAGARYWYQASANHYTSLRFEFFDENNSLLNDSNKATNHHYWVAQHDTWLELNEIQIPANTAYVRIWFSNWGSLAGRPFIGDFTATLTDKTAPAYVETTAVSEAGTYHIGETIRLRVAMNEPVTVTNGGTLETNIGNAVYAGQNLGDSSDVGQYIYYDLTITDSLAAVSNKYEIKPVSLSGLSVADDAGNTALVNTNQNFSVSDIYMDNQYPSVTAVSLYRVNGNTSIPKQVIPEDMVTYAVTFDEKVSFSSNPTFSFAVGDANFSCTAADGTVSADGKTLYFTATLTNCGKNGVLRLNGISGLTLIDENGNTTVYENSALTDTEIAYKSVYGVSKELTNLNLASGAETASYGSAWNGRLTAAEGYKLPASIVVKVGGNALTGGYTYSAATGEIEIAAASVKNDIVISASGMPQTYNVVLNAQGGSGGATVVAVYDSEMPVIAAPDKPGYLFGGYFDERNGGGTKYYNADCSSASIYRKTEGITLYALWTPITYDIQLYSRGENVGTLNDVIYGELHLPSAESLGISYTNHNFVGWNIYDEQNWAMYTADRDYSAGLVTEQGKIAYIYAAWLEKDKYTVTYDANGGTGAPSAVEVHVDETIVLSGIVPSRENYTFAGWSENSGAATAQYQPNDSFTMGNSLITLFAVWNRNPELIYNANGGIFNTYAGTSYPAAGSEVTLTSAIPQKEGYIFVGWAESETAAASDIISAPYIMPDNDTVLYAVYEPIKYEVNIYAADGYSVSGINEDGYIIGEYAEFTVSGTAPKVYINGILATPTDGIYKFEIQNNASVVVADASLVNVIYNANGGVNAPVDVRVYASGDTAVVASGVPEKTGYTFSGWAGTADLEYAEYTAGSSIPVAAEDIVLYAVWTPITYTVKYDAAGGSGDMTATAAVYDEEFTLAENTFTKAGCQFAGWSYASGGELAYVDEARVSNLTDVNNGEITLYAVWKGAQTTVRFHFEGGSSGTSSCETAYGEILPTDRLTAPGRYGYVFAGYYTLEDKGGELVYNADMSLSEYYQANPWDSVAAELNLYAAWEPVNYTVAFVNGTENLQGTIDAVYGQSFFLPQAEELGISLPAGYSFRGWSIASGSDIVYYSAGQEITTGLTGENGITVYLYAVIQENESYTVTLPASGEGYKVYYNESELTSQTDIRVNENEKVSFNISVEEGYSTDRMIVLANGVLLTGNKIGSTYTYTVFNIEANQLITVTGVEFDKYVVTYMVDEQIYLTVQTGYNALLTEPVSPAKAGSTFKGWSDGSHLWSFSADKVIEDTTLYAVWDNDTFKVTPAASGSGYTVTSDDDQTVAFGGSYTFIVTVSDHYNADAMKVYANGVLLVPDVHGNVYTFTVENITADVAITVRDVAEGVYTVKYIVDGEIYYSENVVYAGQAQRPRTPVKAGYIFDGWFAGDEKWDFDTGIEDDLELEAKFTRLVYRVTVPDAQSEFTVNAVSANPVEYGGSFAFDIIVADGYNTADMMVYANGILLEKLSENENTVSFELTNITEPQAITVRGIGQNTYAVTYRANTTEYVGNMPDNAIKAYGSDIAISDLLPERYGYRFLGWSTTANAGVEYTALDIYSENSDLTLYAVWEAMTFAVSFETGGGSIESGEVTEYTYGTGAVLPIEVIKEGYDFAGWYEDELLQGVRVYEIKETDYGDKKYYAAYSMADVVINGYTGEYDGKEHNITYTLADNVSVADYQWYFVPDGASEAIAVSSDYYHNYAVKDADESGEYYCCIETVSGSYVIRMFTEKAKVAITKKPISVKAADSGKVYDAQPLAVNEIELTDGSSLADNHIISAVMTEESTLTNVGTKANEIERITILDSENRDVTANYEITKQSGTLSVTPRALIVAAENVRIAAGSVLNENHLYKISGVLGNENLSLANTSVSAKNADGEDVSIADIADNTGKYTVTIVYSGFDGAGSENYQGSGTITSTVTVYKSTGGSTGGGGGSSGGSGGVSTTYTVEFDTNGGSSVASQSVNANAATTEPKAPEKEGYAFDGWYIDNRLTERFDFATRITKSITLYAKWTASKTGEEQNSENLPVADPTETGVADLLETERHIQYLNGYDNGTFRPKNSMTRAEAAQMFYNLLLNKEAAGVSAFDDVSRNAWYYDAVITLANMGIIKGKGNDVFDPKGKITRAEFTAIAMRFSNIDANGSKTFTDVSEKHWAAKNIADAAALGWISGNGDGTFSPNAFITRASAAKIVNNMLGRKADMEYVSAHADSIKLFKDVSSSAWYYADVVEATNAHEYEKAGSSESWKQN